MSNTAHRLTRRNLLHGAGLALTLPAFQSLGRERGVGDQSPRRLVCVGNHLGFYPGNFFPKAAGSELCVDIDTEATGYAS